MRDKIYLATFGENALKCALEENLKLEIDELCISSNFNPDEISKTRKRIREEFLEPTGNVGSDVIFHGPFTEICPSAIDEDARDFSRGKLESACRLVRDLGGKRMVVHSGYIPFIYTPEWHIKKSIEFWKIFMEGKPDNFNIYIENVLDEDPYIIAEIVDGISDERVKACLDLGHANAIPGAKNKPEEWIEILGSRIAHFHFHNNDGEKDAHNPLKDGKIDYKKILETIKSSCPDATITIESRDCKPSIEWLKEQHYL